MSTNSNATNDWGNLSLDVLDRLDTDAAKVALRQFTDGEWHDVTISEFHDQVRAAAKGLLAHGVEPGDAVAVLAKTRYEWTVIDYAIWWIGAVTVPIYETSSAAQIAWILSDCEAVLVFYDSDLHAEHLSTVRADLPALTNVLPISSVLTQLATSGVDVSDEALEDARSALSSSTTATIIYTSGTTGPPKGCVITHGNLRAELAGTQTVLPEIFDNENSSTILFLPLAHVFARIIQVGAIRWGAILSHSADMRVLGDHMAAIQPTFLLAVPRVFEEFFNAASNKAWADGSGRTFDSAARTAIAWSRAIESGRSPSLALRSRHAMYSRLVYSKIREGLGGKVSVAISGGAPLGERLGHFYRGIGINVLEGYGLTETAGAVSVNTVSEQRIGTVGKPLPHTAVRVNDDGELEFRGPQVFSGYLNQPEATAEVLSEDGWFSTGDMGELDEDGFIRIFGRKKEIIVTAGGKNVSPALLEDRIRSHKLISQCLVVGEGKPFVAALVTINTEEWDGSLTDPALIEAVQEVIDDANNQVSRAEAIRKFVIMPEDWTEANGYLTPSFKLRRQAVLQDLHDTIEALYVR